MQLPDNSHDSDNSLLSAVANSATCVGTIVEVSEDGRVLVDSPRNLAGPVEARVVIGLVDPARCTVNASALLMFDEDTFDSPIMLGIVSARLPAASSQSRIVPQDEHREKRMVIEADDELVLRCGASSVTLRKDGKLVVKGKNVVSRASQTNRIKGGKVAVN